jgi:Chaperone of endosialidase
MGGSSQTTQTTNQSQATNPWAPTIAPLTGIASNVSGLIPNAAPSATETGAFNTLATNAAAGNPFAPALSNFATSLLQGGGANSFAPAVSSNFGAYNAALAPYLDRNYTDPTSNPQLANVLSTIRSDTTNSVNGMFAGAGRDLSGLNVQTLARGIAQGEAQPLLNQYNTNVGVQRGAQDAAYGAGNTSTGLLSGLNQTALANQGQGAAAGNAALAAQNYGPTQELSVAQMQRGLPLQNYANLEQLLTPLAGLGGTSSGNSTTTGTQTANPWQTAISAAIAAAALGSKFATSDARVKENKVEVGRLHDGLPVYAFNYIGDPTPRIGLLAQDVEKVRPDAVTEVGGVKAVDYAKATQRSGLLSKLERP